MSADNWMVLATVLTAFFTGWAIVQHVMDRRRAKFKFMIDRVSSSRAGAATYSVLLVNVGDGEAFDVGLSISGEEKSETRTARFSNGDKLFTAVEIDNPLITDDVRDEIYLDVELYSEEAKIPKDCKVIVQVTWHQPPYRYWTHKKRIRLRDIEFSRVYG